MFLHNSLDAHGQIFIFIYISIGNSMICSDIWHKYHV